MPASAPTGTRLPNPEGDDRALYFAGPRPCLSIFTRAKGRVTVGWMAVPHAGLNRCPLCYAPALAAAPAALNDSGRRAEIVDHS